MSILVVWCDLTHFILALANVSELLASRVVSVAYNATLSVVFEHCVRGIIFQPFGLFSSFGHRYHHCYQRHCYYHQCH